MAKLEQYLDEASKVMKQYQEGLAYKKQMGFLDKWAMYERFKAGDQWPPATKRTQNLPRPVFNIIKQVINHKVSSVMNENVKMVFTASDAEENSTEEEGADLFTRYSDATWENIKQDQLNEEALDSGATTGVCIWHYFWDTSKTGGNRLKYVGELAGEVIDAVNFFPGNPQNPRVQEQPYIIITYRDLVENVRELAKESKVSQEIISLIRSDNETTDQAYDMAQQELTDDSKVTVLTKYWKENGTVFFEKVASGVVVKPKTDMKIKLYPIAVMQWERRKRSIFGTSDVEGLIPNQKSINFLIAMQILSAQQTGWPKLILDPNLIKQRPRNEPGEVVNVIGFNGSVNNAISYLEPPTMPSFVPNLVDALITYTKEMAGANENALGEQNTGQLNASAIMLLQKASGIPLESIKRRFYQACEDIGRIWEEFWKVYYNTDRIITVKDDDGNEETVTFNGSKYQDIDMKLKIDIGPSSNFSEEMMMTSLDKLFDGQHITLEQYLKYAPKNVVPFKDRLLREIQEQQEEAEAQQGDIFNQLLSQLPPEEQQAFMNAPQEVREQIKAQMMQQINQEQQAPAM